jgi:hypothetical protein
MGNKNKKPETTLKISWNSGIMPIQRFLSSNRLKELEFLI